MKVNKITPYIITGGANFVRLSIRIFVGFIRAKVLIFSCWISRVALFNIWQTDKKINVVTSWANVQNDKYFTQNGRIGHFEWK